MGEIGLLDCTLRDGGYVNDWNFGHSTIVSTYKRLDEAGCDYIEVGFLDDRRVFDINKSIAPTTVDFNTIFSRVQKKHAVPVAMIDYGTCAIDNIESADKSFIDGIRVIFKKEKIDEAIPYCRKIKEKGYKLFIQAISITAYSDLELLEYINVINDVKPYAFSIVDTYGLLDNRKLAHIFDMIDNNLDTDIRIGYHAHNNFQLAFSNSIKFLSLMTRHDKVVDSTIYGMGKSAGNCPSELIAMHMNQCYGTDYDLNQFLEALDAELLSIYQNHYWGYRYNFYISAMQNCHPNYVQYLLDKKTLAVSSVNEILSMIPAEKKLLYDPDLIGELYLAYQSNDIDDEEALISVASQIGTKKVVLLGPGRSIKDNFVRVQEHLKKADSICIAVNFNPSMFKCDYVFVSNTKRYNKLIDADWISDSETKLIITSNITPISDIYDYILNYQSLLKYSDHNDNALLLCLNALAKMGVKVVELAGFDGFSRDAQDYYDISYSFAGNSPYLLSTNSKTISGLRELSKRMEIGFLTESIYQEGLNEN